MRVAVREGLGLALLLACAIVPAPACTNAYANVQIGNGRAPDGGTAVPAGPANFSLTNGHFTTDGGLSVGATGVLINGVGPLRIDWGPTTTDGGITLGTGGSQILFSKASTGALDFGDILTLSCADLTQTATGCAVNDPTDCAWPAAMVTGLSGTCWVTATNTITYRLCNNTIGTINPVSLTYSARCWH